MSYYNSKSREAPDKSRLSTPRKLLLFLNRLAARHISEYGAIAKGLETLADGKQADMTSCYIPDDKMKLAAHVLSTLGQDSSESRASWLAKVCTIAIDLSTDRDNEAMTQLADALEVLAEPESGTPTTTYDIEALQAQFVGSQVEIKESKGREFYTFKGRAAYPAELTIGGDLFRLCSASYRKGTYEKIKPANPTASEPVDREVIYGC